MRPIAELCSYRVGKEGSVVGEIVLLKVVIAAGYQASRPVLVQEDTRGGAYSGLESDTRQKCLCDRG